LPDSSEKHAKPEIPPPMRETDKAEAPTGAEVHPGPRQESSSVVNEQAWKNPGHFEITSENGKPKSVEGWLSSRGDERSATDRKYQGEVVSDARGTGKDAGHLIGHGLGGPNAESHGEKAKDNLIPMDSRVNRSEVACLERHLTDQMSSGKSVYLKTEVNYEGEGERRQPVSVTYGWAVRDSTTCDPPARLTETTIPISDRPDRTWSQTMEPSMGHNGTKKASDWFDQSRKGTVGEVN